MMVETDIKGIGVEAAVGVKGIGIEAVGIV
jgi:hypothetical protein